MKKLLIVAIVAMLGGMVFISCDESAGTKVYSNNGGTDICIEITTSIAEVQAMYDSDSAFSEDACPSTNVVGTCSISSIMGSDSFNIDTVYYSPTYAAMDGSSCMGTWN